MCLYPRLIKNPRYKETKKNMGVIPPCNDIRKLSIPIGCGKCMECMRKKRNEWMTRLTEDIKENKNGKFITLTFSNESYKELSKNFKLTGYELDNAISSLAIRRFTERWRKKYKKTIRHWIITELGQTNTEHLHMHGIVWTNESMEEVEKIWKYGWIWKGKEYRGKLQNYVNTKTINYITKYVTKTDIKHKEYKPIILCSNGIGANYTKSNKVTDNKYKGKETRDHYIKENGSKGTLPIYYRNKIYTEEEREELWTNKLDENIRYVNKIKIDISKNDKEYWKQLKIAREINARLGYGNNHVNWNRKEYETQTRIMKQGQRGIQKEGNITTNKGIIIKKIEKENIIKQWKPEMRWDEI